MILHAQTSDPTFFPDPRLKKADPDRKHCFADRVLVLQIYLVIVLGRCSILPAIHDLLMNLSLPNENSYPPGPPMMGAQNPMGHPPGM